MGKNLTKKDFFHAKPKVVELSAPLVHPKCTLKVHTYIFMYHILTTQCT